MRFSRMAIAAVVLSSMSFSAYGDPDGTPRKLSGEYSFYSGSLGDSALPTKKDTKVRMEISGTAALRMYGYMGAGAKTDSCTDEKEVRARGQLVCSREKGSGKVECYFGFDMRSGKSIGGVIC